MVDCILGHLRLKHQARIQVGHVPRPSHCDRSQYLKMKGGRVLQVIIAWSLKTDQAKYKQSAKFELPLKLFHIMLHFTCVYI